MILNLAETLAPPWYLNPAFLPAATGFIGVLTGALIAAVSNFFLDEKRDQRKQAEEEMKRAREAKRAARLINLEFENAAACAAVAFKSGEYWPPQHVPLALNEWEKYKADIATELNHEEWAAVRTAVGAIRYLNYCREVDLKDPGADPVMPAVSKEFKQSVDHSAEQIKRARNALSGFE